MGVIKFPLLIPHSPPPQLGIGSPERFFFMDFIKSNLVAKSCKIIKNVEFDHSLQGVSFLQWGISKQFEDEKWFCATGKQIKNCDTEVFFTKKNSFS